MNLILLENADAEVRFPRGDPRAEHLERVLGARPGDVVDVGAVDGPRGKGRVSADGAGGMVLEITWGEIPPPPFPVVLAAGLPRPQTARRILREATALGVAEMVFFGAEKGEPSYASSRLWSSGEWRRHLLQGAEQAFTTHLPRVRHFGGLGDWIGSLGAPAGPAVEGAWGGSGTVLRVALDVYEAAAPLPGVAGGGGGAGADDTASTGDAAEDDPSGAGDVAVDDAAVDGAAGTRRAGAGVFLAVGPERGWSAGERENLRGAGFTLAHLGERVLRAETACLVALGMIIGRWW